MALILTSYDVSGGETRTATVAAPSFAQFQTLLSGALGRIIYHIEQMQSTGDWIPVKNDNGEPIIFTTLDDLQNGENLLGLSGSDISIRVVPLKSASGTLSIDVLTDGTI